MYSLLSAAGVGSMHELESIRDISATGNSFGTTLVNVLLFSLVSLTKGYVS